MDWLHWTLITALSCSVGLNYILWDMWQYTSTNYREFRQRLNGEQN